MRPIQVRHSVNATHGYHTVRRQLRSLVLQARTARARSQVIHSSR